MRPATRHLPTNPLDAACIRRAAFLFAGALILRAIYYLMIRRTGCLDINLDPISDMETFHRWALTIVQGDWLGRGDFHPFHPWQTAVASREQWSLWYGHVYHQEPFYPYVIAMVYLLAPREPSSVILVQFLAGAAGCALTYLLARRLVPEGAALAAGVLAVLYGPYYYYESLLLRDSLMIPLNALMLWVLVEAGARSGESRRVAWWIAGGALGGVACVTKASVVPFLGLFALWTVVERRGEPAVARMKPALAMAAGFLAIFLPVAARNAAVGAPLTKITTRGPIEFINGNNPWHIGIGWFDGDDQRVSRYANETLARSGGGLLSTVGVVLRGWSGDPAGFLRLQAVKTGWFFAPFEMPNNASYSYFRLNSGFLRHATLSFLWISPLALLGLIESWSRRRQFVPIYLFLGCGILTTVIFYVIARFRAPFMPAVLVLAALGGWSLLHHARRLKLGRLALQLLLAGTLLAVNISRSFPDEDLVRPQDYLISMQGYLARGMKPQALAEAESGRRLFRGLPEFHKAAARLYLELGRKSEALAAYRDALARDPGDAESRRQVTLLGSSP